MADDKDKKIGEVPHIEDVTGNEKIPVSANGEPRYVEVKQIYDKQVTPYPKENEIVYTTTDGEAIELDDTNIVSNVYYKDKGFGVITFKENLKNTPSFFNSSRKDKISKIILPETVEIISERSFSLCSNLEELNIPASLKEIRTDGLKGTKLQSIKSSQDIKYGTGAFVSSNLKSIFLVRGNLDGGAQFEDNFELNTATLPTGITKINSRLFRHCYKLRDFLIPESVKTIESEAFKDCFSFTYITIPQSVTSIHATAFENVIPFYFDTYLPTTQGFPYSNRMHTLVLRYDGVVEDIETYATTFAKEPIAIPEASTLDLVDSPMPINGAEPMPILNTYIGTPNNWLRIYVPNNLLKAYQERYPTLKSHFHPITGEDVYAMREDTEKAVEIIQASGESLQAEVGKYYLFNEEVNTLAVTLPNIPQERSPRLKALVLSFTTGDSPQVTIAADVDIEYFSGYSIEPDTSYELNLMYNGVKWIVAYGVVE